MNASPHRLDLTTLLLLTLTAQLLGHSLMNRLLATVPATVISLTILLELPGAAIIAAIVLAVLRGQFEPGMYAAEQ